jgi:hypothetical protein
MLKGTKRRLAVLSVSATVVLAGGAAAAMAVTSTDDLWKAGANSSWAASSGKTTFVSSVVTITCAKNTAGGSSVGTGPDRGALAMNAPTFSSCKDNLGGTDTVTTKTTGWKVAFVSDIGNAKCPTGTGKDETSGGDCVVITVPQDAATIKLGTLGCTLTVQPGGATTVGASASDPGGTTKDKFTLTSQSVAYSGCGTSGTAKFSGTYTLLKPNNGVLVDKS